MLYEQRIYHAMPGRMPDLLKRFEQRLLGADGVLGGAVGSPYCALHAGGSWVGSPELGT